jgi:histidinol-phosphate aminotransferase
MECLLRSLVARLPADLLVRYPDLGPLYRKLAGHLGIEPDRLLLAAGSDGAIRTVFETFVAPGDRVVIPAPTFAMYAVYARAFGAELVPIAYERGDQGPHLPIGRVFAEIAERRPRLVCLPNPDSPTGTVTPPTQLVELVSAACETGTVMLIDEAYFPFYAESALPLVETFPNLVVTRTFGKAWALAGARVGFAVACQEMTAWLHKMRPMYEIGAVSAALTEMMLDHAEDVEQSVARLLAGKRHFLDEMTSLGFKTLRGHGNFLHVAFGERPAIHAALRGKVLYRRDFEEPCLAGYSRFSATTREGFMPVIDLIRDAIGNG